jgi:hypothetical protein
MDLPGGMIPLLEIDYFNPVVSDWNETAYQRELQERETCGICLYVISPEMTGVYSIAEVVDDSNKRPHKTVFYFTDGFDDKQTKSLEAVGKMVLRNGGCWRDGTIQELAEFLNDFCYYQAKFMKDFC